MQPASHWPESSHAVRGWRPDAAVQAKDYQGGQLMRMGKRSIICGALSALLGGTAFAGTALALTDGQPDTWQWDLQPAATAVARQMHDFDRLLLVIIISISAFVLALLVYAIWRYNEKANPTPAKFSHNTLIEVIWTVVPLLILVVIAIPSFRLLYAQYEFPKADLTVKATGRQWYWSYQYPDQGNFNFDSLLVEDADLKEGQPRLLAVDNEIVVPVNKVVHMLVTSSDVIHSWTIPAFGVKIDGIPGRVTRTWFKAEKTGVFYGQCSELCGSRHAFMPIAVRVVSEQDFASWVEKAKKQFAATEETPALAKTAEAKSPAPAKRIADAATAEATHQ
jgi:cytochrome c oxidase subunit 2